MSTPMPMMDKMDKTETHQQQLTMALTALEPLTSVALVLRRQKSEGSAIESLPHVVELVTSYLEGDISSWRMMERVLERGFGLRMLKRLAVHEELAVAAGSRPPMDPFYRGFLASKALVAAVKSGDYVGVVRWICCEYCPSVVPVNAMIEAAGQGRLRVLQWLNERYPSVELKGAVVKQAVSSGQTDVAQWILSSLTLQTESIEDLLTVAVESNHLQVVQFLCEQLSERTAPDGPHFTEALSVAILSEHFEVAKYFVDKGYRLDRPYNWQIPYRVVSGNLAMIKWLRTHQLAGDRTPWLEDAASAGHLDIVKWIHVNMPEDTSTKEAMNGAASGGHLEVVKWLHANRTEGCTREAMHFAAVFGHLEIVKWLHENRTEGCSHSTMKWAANRGHLDVVKRLHENRNEGCTTSAMDTAASLEILRWLHENRTEGCTEAAMENAACGGKFEALLFMKQAGIYRYTSRGAYEAVKNDHFEIFHWLRANYPDTTSVMRATNIFGKQSNKWVMFEQFEASQRLRVQL